MNDSRDFKDAESVRSGLSHVPSQPALFPPYRDPGWMPSRPGGMLSRNDKPPDIWDTHGTSGNVFCKSTGFFFITLSRRVQSLDFWRKRKTHHRIERVNVRFQTQLWIWDASQDRQPEIQSSLKREFFQRIVGQTNKDCRSRNFTLTNSLHQQHLLVGR